MVNVRAMRMSLWTSSPRSGSEQRKAQGRVRPRSGSNTREAVKTPILNGTLLFLGAAGEVINSDSQYRRFLENVEQELAA